MKTPQIIERDFMGSVVRQNHKNQYFCINDITKIGNIYRRNKGLSEVKWAKYKSYKKQLEFFESLMKEENNADIIKTTRGKNSTTWVHPLVFIDYALWISPETMASPP